MFKFVKYISGVALIGATSFLAQDIALAGNGFSASCPLLNINNSSKGWSLDTVCSAKNHSLIYNHLPLNPHIANDNGNLVWRKNGGFSASVKSCHLGGTTGATLTCYALIKDNSYNISSINLDDEIANYNGHLRVLGGF